MRLRTADLHGIDAYVNNDSTQILKTKQCYTRLDGDDHSRTEFNGSLYVIGVMNVHSKIMAYMMWTELTRHL